MALNLAHDVLLFFQDYDHDTFVKNDRHLRRIVRRLYQHLRPACPRVSGFEVWFRLLKKALERCGRRVHVNAHRLARQNPEFPVGLCGYPHILKDWTLPNPAVLGPGMFDHPALAPNLMDDPRHRLYVTTCDWTHDMFVPVYGADRCVHWHAGIDVAEWPDLGGAPKDIDVLVYDKIRWQRDHYQATLLTTIRRELAKRHLTSAIVRYRHYNHAGFRKLLARSRSLLFLCESETQGMAYQEALASSLPVLAWDPGFWADPRAVRYDPRPIPACSVPFFDERCGERFRDEAQVAEALDHFWERHATYRPREFVHEKLSIWVSGQTYLGHLVRAAR